MSIGRRNPNRGFGLPQHKTMAPKSTSSPRGLSLSKTHTIGEKIGAGEFGEVYALQGSTNDTEWVVKVVPIPQTKTKKQNSPPEIALARLYHEYLCYTNCRKFSGTLLPLLPSPLKDKVDMFFENRGGKSSTARKFPPITLILPQGFRCLVMERLQGDLFGALPRLVDSSSRFVELGKTAIKFIDILKAMHDSSYLVVDIKPDNFMVASLGSKVTDDSLAQALRLIDLGLVKSLTSVGGHIANDGTTGVSGNALYASLHVHEHNTPSRRDDVQAVLFLIGEIVLQVQALDNGTAPPYGRGDRASHLPWSQEQSDEGVGGEKRRQVLDRNSAFYEIMPSDAANILFQCITAVNEYSHKKKPDYETLRVSLSTLRVPRTSNHKPAARKTNKQALKSQPTRKSPRRRSKDTSTPKDDDNDETEGPAASKRPSKHARARALFDDDDDVIMEEVDADDDNIENEEANVVDLTSVKGFGLCCEEKDLWIVLSEETGTSTVVVGSQPSSDGATFTLKDESLLPSHVTLSISATFEHGINVKPRNKLALVKVNNGKVPVGGTHALLDQKVAIGLFSFNVRRLPVKTSSKSIVRKQTTSYTAPIRRVFLEIVEGSLSGNKYELIRGTREVVTIGSKPIGATYLIFLDDPGVAANHLRLELVYNKSNGTTVCVQDVGSTTGLEINDEVFIEEEVYISTDSVIKLSNKAAVSLTFVD